MIAGTVLLTQAVVIAVIVAVHAPVALPVVTTAGSVALPVSGVDVGVGVIVPVVLGGMIVLTGGAWHRRLGWLESSLSASITVFLIAQLNGIRELGTLVAIYALTSAAVLFGVLHEGRRDAPSALAGVFGAMVGVVPWGLIAWYEIAPAAVGHPGPDVWVRVLTLTVLGLFVGSAVLAWRGTGASPLGIALSVVARSVLAWTVTAAIVAGQLLR